MKQVSVGCKVTLRFPDGEGQYFVRNSHRQAIGLGEISTDSPLGKILVGKKRGDVVSTVCVGSQAVSCTIVSVG